MRDNISNVQYVNLGSLTLSGTTPGLSGYLDTRGFDAAGGGRRWEGARTVDGLNTAILSCATTAARRAGWYARNNPWVAAAVDSRPDRDPKLFATRCTNSR